MNPESIREEIRLIVDNSLKDYTEVQISPEVKHVIVEICYTMHRAGMKDAFMASHSVLNQIEDNLTK
jgi:hypothetical protein